MLRNSESWTGVDLVAVQAARRNAVAFRSYVFLLSCRHIWNNRRMNLANTVETLSALAQETRLSAFRLLVEHEPEGLPAGEIARRLQVPHNTLSTHLGALARAGLVTSQRQSRSIIYRANLDQMQKTINFLIRDCCAGNPAVCGPLLSVLASESSYRNE